MAEEQKVADDMEARHSAVLGLRRFLADHRGVGGPVVVKTSTASLRDASSEPASELLDLLLAEVRSAFGSSRRLILADGPAFEPNFVAIAEVHGWDHLAGRHGAELVDLNERPGVPALDGRIHLAPLLSEAGLIVSVVKAKTHRRTGISGAEKAGLGHLVGLDMGYPKLEHRHFLIPGIYRVVAQASPPTYHVIDGVGAVQGQGPLRGEPSEHRFVIHGDDPTACDIALARRYCFDPTIVISLHHAVDRPALNVDVVSRTSVAVVSDSPPIDEPAITPPDEQPWLHRSLRGEGSRRNRKSYRRIRAAFVETWEREFAGANPGPAGSEAS